MVNYVAILLVLNRSEGNKEPLLLETMDGIPFLENACCNEGGANTNHY